MSLTQKLKQDADQQNNHEVVAEKYQQAVGQVLHSYSNDQFTSNFKNKSGGEDEDDDDSTSILFSPSNANIHH